LTSIKPKSPGNVPDFDMGQAMRPTIQADGGDLELVEVSEDGDVVVRLHGACVGCPSSSLTLRTGIERNLQVHVPEVRSVRAVE